MPKYSYLQGKEWIECSEKEYNMLKAYQQNPNRVALISTMKEEDEVTYSFSDAKDQLIFDLIKALSNCDHDNEDDYIDNLDLKIQEWCKQNNVDYNQL